MVDNDDIMRNCGDPHCMICGSDSTDTTVADQDMIASLSEPVDFLQGDDLLPTDFDLEQMTNDIFGDNQSKVIFLDAPDDLDSAFAQIFGEQPVPSGFPLGALWFSVDEMATISKSLKFRGKSIAKAALDLIDPSMDKFWDNLPTEVAYELNMMLIEATEESEKCRVLYHYFSEKFGIAE